MKFLIDADSPYSLIEVLKSYAHDAVHAGDVLKFATDDKILEYANKNNCIIVTRDLGFAEMFLKNKGFGLILVRLPYNFTSSKVIKIFKNFMKEIDVNKLVNSITVLELGRYRNKKIL